MLSYKSCNLCPRMCGANRTKQTGFCGCGTSIRAARAAPHFWEEPCISGSRGSGTVFFSGCTLGCVYCQNRELSAGHKGRDISPEQLSEIFLRLQDEGVHNINLVTPTQYLPPVITALRLAEPALRIPVVYNCGGYERVETVRVLSDYVNIFLPDIKYKSTELSEKYSGAPDYFEKASAAITEMIRLAGPPVFGEDGMLRRGVILRHLVLPGCRHDSAALLEWMAGSLPQGGFLLSLMSQYTPQASAVFPELARRVTKFEYQSVVKTAVELGLCTGYIQEKTSAEKEYTPPFNFTGI